MRRERLLDALGHEADVAARGEVPRRELVPFVGERVRAEAPVAERAEARGARQHRQGGLGARGGRAGGGRALQVGAETPPQRRTNQRAQNRLDTRTAAAFQLRGFQFGKSLAVQHRGAADEQFGEQFVLGPEMIVHRGQIDAGGGHDVAHRDFAETTLCPEHFSGGENGGFRLVARHRSHAK